MGKFSNSKKGNFHFCIDGEYIRLPRDMRDHLYNKYMSDLFTMEFSIDEFCRLVDLHGVAINESQLYLIGRGEKPQKKESRPASPETQARYQQYLLMKEDRHWQEVMEGK